MKPPIESVTCAGLSGSFSLIASEGASHEEIARNISGPFSITARASAAYTHAVFYDEVCALLPGEWEARALYEDRWDTPARLVRADGLTVILMPFSYSRPGEGVASYLPPRDAKGAPVKSAPKAIRFSMSKGAARIAADIARRLLPEAELAHLEALAEVSRTNAFYNTCAEIERAVQTLHHPDLRFEARGASIYVSGYLSVAQARALTPGGGK
jgi:hypothetical protein